MRNWNKCLYFIKHYLFMMADDQFKVFAPPKFAIFLHIL